MTTRVGATLGITYLQIGAAGKRQAIRRHKYCVKFPSSSAHDVMFLQCSDQRGHVAVGGVTKTKLPFL